jgi:hypothetical protein
LDGALIVPCSEDVGEITDSFRSWPNAALHHAGTMASAIKVIKAAASTVTSIRVGLILICTPCLSFGCGPKRLTNDSSGDTKGQCKCQAAELKLRSKLQKWM